MHETTVAANIIDIVRNSIPSGDLAKIAAIRLKVGLLANVMKDSLLFSFNSLKENTPFPSAILEINEMPLIIKCLDCEKENTGNDFIFCCPACRSTHIEVTGGDELSISEIIINPD